MKVNYFMILLGLIAVSFCTYMICFFPKTPHYKEYIIAGKDTIIINEHTNMELKGRFNGYYDTVNNVFVIRFSKY